MEALLEKYKAQKPEIVFEWHDEETDAMGWVVINSLRNGAAGGGTRMRLGLTKEEVVSLAKVMEIKFSVCGPKIGGAKSGINFNPADPRRNAVLKRWYKAVYPLLKESYSLNFFQIGMITFTFQLTASLLQPIVGFYTDRFPWPYTLVSGMGFAGHAGGPRLSRR